jgi:hypothetical protein
MINDSDRASTVIRPNLSRMKPTLLAPEPFACRRTDEAFDGLRRSAHLKAGAGEDLERVPHPLLARLPRLLHSAQGFNACGKGQLDVRRGHGYQTWTT